MQVFSTEKQGGDIEIVVKAGEDIPRNILQKEHVSSAFCIPEIQFLGFYPIPQKADNKTGKHSKAKTIGKQCLPLKTLEHYPAYCLDRNGAG